jgi:hypothetical protein
MGRIQQRLKLKGCGGNFGSKSLTSEGSPQRIKASARHPDSYRDPRRQSPILKIGEDPVRMKNQLPADFR